MSFDFYRGHALRHLSQHLVEGDPAQVHPKYALFADSENYSCQSFEPNHVADSHLEWAREAAVTIFNVPRDEMTEQRISVGDTLGFHYDLARAYVMQEDVLLDVACGGGRGSYELAKICKHVTGADIDGVAIAHAKEQYGRCSNVVFEVADVLKLPFESACFDCVTSFETIEPGL